MTKEYSVYPNFKFNISANSDNEARDKAYETLKKMGKITYFDFDFVLENEEGEEV